MVPVCAWSAWAKIFTSKVCPFLTAGGHGQFSDRHVIAAADAQGHHIQASRPAAAPPPGRTWRRRCFRCRRTTGPGASGRFRERLPCPGGWRWRCRCAPTPTTAWIWRRSTWALGRDSMAASLPKTSTPAVSLAFFALASLIDIGAGQFLLRRGHALRAVEHVKDGHAFDGLASIASRPWPGPGPARPASAGPGPSSAATAPIWTSDFQDSQTTHGSRRRQRQQPDWIGELEVHFTPAGVLAQELLHAIVQRVGHVKIALGIQRDAPRIAELAGRAARAAQDFQRLVIGVKYLDAAVAEFADELQPGPSTWMSYG